MNTTSVSKLFIYQEFAFGFIGMSMGPFNQPASAVEI